MAAVVPPASPLSQHPSAPSQTTPTKNKPPSTATSPTPMQSQPQPQPQPRHEAQHPDTPQRVSSPSVASIPSPPSVDTGLPAAPVPIPLSNAVESLNLNAADNESSDAHSAVLTDAAPRVPSSSSSSSADDAGPDSDTDDAAPHPEDDIVIDTDHAAHTPVEAPATDGVAASTSTSNVPPLSTAAPPSSTAATKPKSKAKRVRALSRTPPPPPRPPPRLTVRLDIKLGGPNDYEVNILQLARETNQRPVTPPPPARDGSDSDSSSDDDAAAAGAGQGVKLVVKRKRREKQYDLDDPFIDDSDLFIDAPTHFAQTKQQGFYVSSGDVALVKDKSPRKPQGGVKGAPGVGVDANAGAGGAGSGPGGKGAAAGGKPKGPSLTSLLMNATAVAEAPTKVAALTTIHGEVKSGATATTPTLGQAPQTPVGNGAGTRESPIALLDEEEGGHGAGGGGGGGDAKPGRLLPPQFVSHSNMDVDGIGMGASSTAGRRSISGGDGAPSAKRIKLDPSESTGGGPQNMFGGGESSSMMSAAGGSDAGGTKKRKISKDALEQVFHPDVTEALRGLKTAVDQANWTQKGKFPPHLKPLLQQVAVHALRHGDYNDDFFDYLPTIFPYNRFTMMKLTSRLMYNDHQGFLQERQDALLEELRQIAIEDFPKAQEDYAKATASWEERQKKKLVGAADGTAQMDLDSTAAPGLSRGPSPAGTGTTPIPPVENADAVVAAATAPKREEKAPVPRYKWTEPIKARVWGLVHLSNEMCRLSATMVQWDPQVQPIMEHSLKKALYAKIVAAFPEGWMNTGVISREISAMKAKLKKESEIATGAPGAISTGDMSS